MTKSNVLAKLALAAVALTCGAATAQAQDKDKVEAARKYLTNKANAEGILFFMHPTAQFESVSCDQFDVTDSKSGQVRKGWFCLRLRFVWKSKLFDDDNTSDLHVFYDDKGRLHDVRAGATTTFVKPFAAANLALAAVKDALLENVKDPAERKAVAKLIEGGDARLLLRYLLQMDQK
jgi:hypothetical protein